MTPRSQFHNHKYAKDEVSMAKFIPYRCHWDSSTILTHDERLIKVIRIKGISFEAMNDVDLEIKKQMRNILYKSLAYGNLSLYFHIVRQKNAKIPSQSIETNIEFLRYVQSKWDQKHQSAQYFTNELYISIIYKTEKEGVAFIDYMYKKLMQKKSEDYWGKNLKRLSEEMEDVSARMMSALQDYSPTILSLNEETQECEILSFLFGILNCGISSKVIAPKTQNISDNLGRHRLTFKDKHLELKTPTGTKYASIISVKEYSPYTSTIMLDGFLKTDYEFVITQSFDFINKNIAIGKIQLQQNRLIQAEDKSISQISDISAAMDLATSGDIAFGVHHLSIMCIDTDLRKLENTVPMAITELSNYGIQAIKATTDLEPAFWGQLPGNNSFIVRKSILHTINLADMCALHNYPSGSRYGNHWGEYVTILNTTSKTPYYFSFHVRDVGHTMIVGPTGSGKTVLMNFLCAQLQKFKPRMYFFDKDHGAEIFVRALNGTYNTVESGSSYSINPLKMEDTEENRAFLFDWLKMLVTTNGEKLMPEENKIIYNAIEGNYTLNYKDRRLSNIAPFFGTIKGANLASRLELWYGRGAKAQLFDHDEDNLDLTKGSVFGFEMSNILRDKLGLAPVLSYIFHRIQISLLGYPTVIVLDEAWALIDNEVFAPKIKDWLKVLRKLNTFVIFATQSIEDATKSMISDTLIQQTSTQIFLPNLKATPEYKTTFMLSDREFEIVKTTDPASRYFLIKQGVHSVVARIDLKNMGNTVDILSARAETIQILNGIISTQGPDPKRWFYKFCKEINKLNT